MLGILRVGILVIGILGVDASGNLQNSTTAVESLVTPADLFAIVPNTTAVSLTAILSYLPWCVHSQRMLPIWDDLAEDMAVNLSTSDTSVSFARVDAHLSPRVSVMLGVSSYPAIRLVLSDGSIRSITSLSSTSDLFDTLYKASISNISSLDAIKYIRNMSWPDSANVHEASQSFATDFYSMEYDHYHRFVLFQSQVKRDLLQIYREHLVPVIERQSVGWRRMAVVLVALIAAEVTRRVVTVMFLM